MANGTVFNIQKFCLNDGPGIRTTVFLKGCPLKCIWCHNPESHNMETEIFYDEHRCVGCGRCVEVCERHLHIMNNSRHIFQRDNCVKCGKCVSSCCFEAIKKSGEIKSVEEVLYDVLKDKEFYENSGGGMTISGGEPLMQYDFVHELLKAAKTHGIHTCVETCGFADTEKVCKIAEYTDIFLYDWKVTNDNLHKKYTGVSNRIIRQNLYEIDKIGAKMVLRCPVVPDVNDNDDHFFGIAEIANSLENITGIELEPYHSIGNHKYEELDLIDKITAFRTPNHDEVKHWIDKLQKFTDVVVKKA